MAKAKSNSNKSVTIPAAEYAHYVELREIGKKILQTVEDGKAKDAERQAAELAKAAPKFSQNDLEQIGSDVGRVSSLIYSMLHVSRNMDAEEAASIEALCEKAGTIADRCAVALGDIPACGSWERWAGQGRSDVEAREEASHG
ncbi:MAG: hypothetical protein ACTS6J_03450 [Burkholderiales bacterium]